MRIARVNITMPDELYRRARQAGLNVSQLAQLAVAALSALPVCSALVLTATAVLSGVRFCVRDPP